MATSVFDQDSRDKTKVVQTTVASLCLCPTCRKLKRYFSVYGHTQGLSCLGCCTAWVRQELADVHGLEFQRNDLLQVR
jgi:hypothetical protein